MKDQPTGTSFRVEEDALGNVEVPMDHLWGAQTSPFNMEIYPYTGVQ